MSNASDFKRRWRQDAPIPTAANGLEGKWQGEWTSEANGHHGALRCLLARGSSGEYKASFHATYAGFLRVCYSVPLHGQWSDGHLNLEGDADLGPLAGGIYHYQGEAAEAEFVCTYKCKYDHGTFRMKPALPDERQRQARGRLIMMTALAIALLACATVAFFFLSDRVPEAYYQGRSASSWLRDLAHSGGQLTQALEAFDKMGTNAEPVLVAALREKENVLVRIYRGFCGQLPSSIQQHLSKPEQPALLRMAAVVALQHTASSQIISDLYPMFKESDSGLRLAVLQAVDHQVPDASEVSMLVLPANDPDPYLRSQVWMRLRKLEAAATPAVPAIQNLCDDNDLNVRQEAAWTLWRINKQTNTTVPVLESVLRVDPDANERHLIAYHLLFMGDSNQAFVSTLIDSLTNRQPTDRATVCAFLGQIGPPAAPAIPALQKALHDPEEIVRRRAEVALSTIEPRTSTNSP